jgi:histidinol-phosphate/aromatic aminotransferase/cobyric acid decarboxylase-like protein
MDEYENLVVGRTLSKAFGLAGLRLGYAIAPEWIAEQYRRISPLFGISGLSLAAGVAALVDVEYMKSSVAKICSERDRIQSRIEGTLSIPRKFPVHRDAEKVNGDHKDPANKGNHSQGLFADARCRRKSHKSYCRNC